MGTSTFIKGYPILDEIFCQIKIFHSDFLKIYTVSIFCKFKYSEYLKGHYCACLRLLPTLSSLDRLSFGWRWLMLTVGYNTENQRYVFNETKNLLVSVTSTSTVILYRLLYRMYVLISKRFRLKLPIIF